MGEEEPAVQSYEGERNSAGQRHGTGTATFANGDKYTGGYADGLRSGEGGYASASGDKYTGSYAENLRHGAGVMVYGDGSTYEGAWSRSYRHGEGIYDYPNGDHYDGAWAAGAKHGLGVYFFAESRSQFYGYWDCGSFLGGTWTHQDGTVYVGAFEKAVDLNPGEVKVAEQLKEAKRAAGTAQDASDAARSFDPNAAAKRHLFVDFGVVVC